MTDQDVTKVQWPSELSGTDELYALVDASSDEIPYLIFSSMEKGASFVRDSSGWQQVNSRFFDALEDQYQLYQVDVPVGFITTYDSKQAAGGLATSEDISNQPVTAAAEPDTEEPQGNAISTDVCPPATQSIPVNLRNRRKAIRTAGYGPLNPEYPTHSFWATKAELWSITPEEAQQSVCGNCAMFVVTTKMRDCIASGISQGGSGQKDAWDAIDAAQLGYCEAFDFKCAATRTCDAWVTGGPINDDADKNRSASK